MATDEPASIYDDAEVEFDSDALGMEPANKPSRPSGDVSMPVIGLKKPT